MGILYRGATSRLSQVVSGDAYTFLAVERESKLLLAHHVGRRNSQNAGIFAAKPSAAVSADPFQISTGSFEVDRAALEATSTAKSINSAEGLDSERRYSPPQIIATAKRVVSDDPKESRVCISHVERVNLHVRMIPTVHAADHGLQSEVGEPAGGGRPIRRELQLHVVSPDPEGCTPAMAAGLVRRPWTVGDLLAA